jgi:hypothetical protein
MLASRTKAILAVVLGCAAFLAILDPAARAASTGLTVAEELGDEDADGSGGPVGAQGENGPEGDNGAPVPGDHKVMNGAIGPSGVRHGPSGELGAPGAMSENGHARAPPVVLSKNPIGPGA